MQNAANLATGQCGLRDGSRRDMWRLPTKEEWEAMIDKKYYKSDGIQPTLSNAADTGPWKEGDVFFNVQMSLYWSSSSDVYDVVNIWFVNLSNSYFSNSGKLSPLHVWPVRDGE